MIELVYGQDEAVAIRVQEKLSARTMWRYPNTIGIKKDDELIAGLVYHDATARNIQISMASTSPLWCTKKTLRYIFGYPFLQLKVARVTVCTHADNEKMRSLALRLGFQQEGILRDGYEDGDMIVYGMLAKEGKKWIS